jgi:hypothetical protein
MKKTSPKKSTPRAKNGARKGKGNGNLPLEFDRGWQELETQHDRLKSDWTSLAAQMGIGSKARRPIEY